MNWSSKKCLSKKQEIIIKILKKRLCIFPKFLTQKITSTHLKNSQKKIERETTFSKDNFKKAPNFSPTLLPLNSFCWFFLKIPPYSPHKLAKPNRMCTKQFFCFAYYSKKIATLLDKIAFFSLFHWLKKLLRFICFRLQLERCFFRQSVIISSKCLQSIIMPPCPKTENWC